MNRKHLAFLLLITVLALAVHGYHPAVEDGEIYLPGVLKDLHPNLYPFGAEFFESHAHMTLFDELVAGSIRLTHLPFDYAILLWQAASVFVLLWACWRLSRQCFRDPRAYWGSVALVAALLTLPVAGTSLYIMDQYVTTRALSTPGIMMMIACAVERKFVRATLWAVFTALIHPLMVVFGLAYLVCLLVVERWPARHRLQQREAALVGLVVLPMPNFLARLFPPMSDAYREALNTRSYFFLLRWEWYEWLGALAPLLLLYWLSRYGKKHELRNVQDVGRALLWFGVIFLLASLVLTIPARFATFALLQPMRSLHLLYIIMLVLLGGVLGEAVLKTHIWRWLALFMPLCLGMFYAQRELFPATPHLELPWAAPGNRWVEAFNWVRHNTPSEAIFALDPDHMALPGEDQHGFRALAQRSMLADALKDSGAVTMFPKLAEEWRAQVRAQQGWKHFGVQDFQGLRNRYGVTWVVLQQPGVPGLNCPYQNSAVSVCRVP